MRPIITPPTAVPSQPSELASEGAERAPPRSAAIAVNPTAVIQSAPKDVESRMTDTVAVTQEDRVSMLVVVTLVPATRGCRRLSVRNVASPSRLSVQAGLKLGIERMVARE